MNVIPISKHDAKSSHSESGPAYMGSSLDYRPDIDGLRALAVLSVVFCHADLGLKGGYVGVDVFFVISGYLITSLIAKDLRQGTFSLMDFWGRRVRRILPALVVVTLAAIVAGWFILLPEDYANLGKSVIALVLMVSNIHFYQDTGYFAAAADEKPLLHTWSLAVEEQFYLFVPFLAFVPVWIRRARWSLAAVILCGILSFALSVYGVNRHPSATFYLLPTRAWELIVGAIIALVPSVRFSKLSPFMTAAGVAGVLLILIPVVLYDSKTSFPGLAAFPPVAGTALLIWLGGVTSCQLVSSRILGWSPIVFIGKISYSLYLWHWPILVYAKYWNILPLPVPARMGLVFASGLLAVWSWRYVENPFRRWRIEAARGFVVSVAVVVLGIVLVVGIALKLNRGFESRVPSEVLHLTALRFAVPDSMKNYSFDMAYGDNDDPKHVTQFGPKGEKPQVLIWGDSFAMALVPAVESLCQKTGVTAWMAARAGAPPIMGFARPDRRQTYERTLVVNEAIFEQVRLRKIPAVVLVAHWQDYGKSYGPQFETALLKTIEDLKALGSKVYLVIDVPSFPCNVPTALARCALSGRDPSFLRLLPATYTADRSFCESLRQRISGEKVEFLDPLPSLLKRMPTLDLLPYDEDGCFYSDSDHLSPYGALAIEPALAPAFRTRPGK